MARSPQLCGPRDRLGGGGRGCQKCMSHYPVRRWTPGSSPLSLAVRAPLAIRLARLQTWHAQRPSGGAMAVIHAGMPKRSGIFQVTATLGALGVVYGDIGTSPLYAFKEAARAASHGGTVTPDAVLGIVSLILWALILIISIKYALLILRADNHGEGGIVALLALLS